MEETELVLVDTISMFRMRYVVRVPKGKTEYATDTVIMGKDTDDVEIAEFSQLHLDEIVSATRVISEEEYIRQFDEDNSYLKSWDSEMKFRMINNGVPPGQKSTEKVEEVVETENE